MDTIPFIKEILSKPVLRVFLSDPTDDILRFFMEDLENAGDISSFFEGIVIDDIRLLFQNLKVKLREHTEDEKLTAIKDMRVGFRQFGILRRETFERPLTYRGVIWIKKELDSFINGLCGETWNKRELGSFINEFFSRIREKRKGSKWCSQREVTWIKKELDSFTGELVSRNYLEKREVEGELEHKVDIDAVMKKREVEGELEHKVDIDEVMNSLREIKSMEDLLLDNANSSSCLTNDEKSRALLLITAFPDLRELKNPNEMLRFLLELSAELDNLPEQICKACEGQPQALLLIGSLLSCKPMAYDEWNRLKDDLVEIKESTIACYPMNYEIPARSLTEIWIAEGFVEPQEGETIEETANDYLEQLVQRSLVWVSKRSILGAIRCCRVRQYIHEFCIKQSCEEKLSVANPNEQEMKSVSCVAFYNDDKKKYTEGAFEENMWYNASSVVCFDFDMNVLGKNMLEYCPCMDVLEVRKSTIPQTFLPSITDQQFLKYLGLRGSNISELPENIGKIKWLKTLDVRDTNIKTLPESLWTIQTLRHVYVNPSPQIKGPPFTANINDLQILKTVVVSESWLENFPLFLSNLRKLALSNKDIPNSKSNPYWKSISKLLSRMSNLLSMTIIGDIVPSEFVDIRAFPNLETVKSIKLEGEWICRKLFIDNVKFSPNIVKLTLIKSGLKEDPMSILGRLQTLKYLSLQDGVYTGKKMVCCTNGFPQLRFLELLKLENLEIWEVKLMTMSQLTTLRVVQCLKLKILPNLEHVTDKVIHN